MAKNLLNELMYLGIVYFVLVIGLKIIFFNEPLFSVFRIVFGILWVFVLPGFFVLLYWQDSLKFIERLIISAAISFAIIGPLSYYLGLVGVNLKYHSMIFPPVLIVLGLVFYLKKKQ